MTGQAYVPIAEALRFRGGSLDHTSLASPELNAHSLDEFMGLDLPPRRCVLSPILPERGLGMLYAPRGVGKPMWRSASPMPSRPAPPSCGGPPRTRATSSSRRRDAGRDAS